MEQSGCSADGRPGDETLRTLMTRYQQGDLEAFEDLYGQTLPMMRGYLGALARDRARTADLVQEAYLQVHRSRHTYDPAQPIRPWLIGIARHVWLTDRRWRWRRLSKEVTGLETLPELPVPSGLEGLVARDALTRALASLAEDRREALVLHHVYGLSFREIARVAGVSEGGARVRASRAMAELRAALGRKATNG